MRSRKLDLDGVAAKFERWRTERVCRRPLPSELLKAAVGLLDRYPVTTVCRQLRLNNARFNQARRAFGVAPRGQRATTQVRVSRAARIEAAASQVGVNPNSAAFVEFPALNVGGGMIPGFGVPRATDGYRLVLESAAGTLSVVTTSPDRGLIDAVCRFVLGALAGDSRA